MTIIYFLLILGIIITVHEFGPKPMANFLTFTLMSLPLVLGQQYGQNKERKQSIHLELSL